MIRTDPPDLPGALALPIAALLFALAIALRTYFS